MKKIFFSAVYSVKHSEITPENAAEKLADDIRARMLGDVNNFLYAYIGKKILAINPDLEYVGGFYYEEDDAFATCQSIVNDELSEVEKADIVMVSLLKYSAIATLTELLYAARFPEKEIIIFCDPTITKFKVEYEYWYPILAACRTTKNLRVVYVKNDDEILEFIKNYKVYEKRVIVEGADGVGKSTVCEYLREIGVNCLDRKREISEIMVDGMALWERTTRCNDYLDRHPNDYLLFLTTNDELELMERIRKRGGAIDAFDREAVKYNKIYKKTAGFMPYGRERFSEVGIAHLDRREVFLKVCESLSYNGFMKKVIVATNNENKVRELRQIFPDFLLLSLKDLGLEIDVVEDADTFLGNATKKAMEIHKLTGEPVMADDSGIMIDSLDGFPGVLTHRFLGENASEDDRNRELIRMVEGKDRTARFVCKLVYCDKNKIEVGKGELVGKIAERPHGENGFGFDPIFELEDGRTLGEVLPVEKNELSARRLAAVDLEKKLRG